MTRTLITALSLSLSERSAPYRPVSPFLVRCPVQVSPTRSSVTARWSSGVSVAALSESARQVRTAGKQHPEISQLFESERSGTVLRHRCLCAQGLHRHPPPQARPGNPKEEGLAGVHYYFTGSIPKLRSQTGHFIKEQVSSLLFLFFSKQEQQQHTDFSASEKNN